MRLHLRSVFLAIALAIAVLLTSGSACKLVFVSDLVPHLTSLSPASAKAGGAAFTLTVNGSNFTFSSFVRWNGSNRPTAFFNSHQVSAQISASDIASTGTVLVTVVNPGLGGGTSSALPFTILPPTEPSSGGSISSSGAWGDVTSGFPSVSGDARFVGFQSAGGNLVAGATRSSAQIYLRDTCVAVLSGCLPSSTLVSVNGSGRPGNAPSLLPAISADGRYVAFQSFATNLVPDDTNYVADVFLRDTCRGASNCTPSTIRVSLADDDGEANGPSANAALSATGRFVLFDSQASSLVPGPVYAERNVFLRDTCAAAVGCAPATILVSVSSGGVAADRDSFAGSVSADGRFAVFASSGTNLLPGVPNPHLQVYLRDTCFGATVGCVSSTTILSVDSNGNAGNLASRRPVITPDGRFVAFVSEASNLLPGDTNRAADIFVRDTCLGVETDCIPSTRRVSLASSGTQANGPSRFPTISADGRFVAFESDATNLVPEETHDATCIFVRDTCAGVAGCTPSTVHVAARNGGVRTEQRSHHAWISGDGHVVAFVSSATNSAPGDTRSFEHVHLTFTGF